MRAAVLLYTFALLAVTACAQRTAGAIEFADGGTPTVVATPATPAATATAHLGTPTPAAATPTVLPSATPQLATATIVPTRVEATPTILPPTAVATATQRAATPPVGPTAIATQLPTLPSMAPTPVAIQPPAMADPAQQPVFPFPTAELPVGMPGPNSLVYQAFWSGAPQANLNQSAWRGDASWTTANGILQNRGDQPGAAFASPFLTGNANALARSGNYAVEAQVAAESTGGSAFGIYIRRGSEPVVNLGAPRPDVSGIWRAGVVEGSRAFILAEHSMPNQTPADLLLVKALATTLLSPGDRWVTYRLEAHDTHVVFSVDGHVTLQVDDARFDVGDDIGLWADHAAVRVRDFRLYTLP